MCLLSLCFYEIHNIDYMKCLMEEFESLLFILLHLEKYDLRGRWSAILKSKGQSKKIQGWTPTFNRLLTDFEDNIRPFLRRFMTSFSGI